jgi:hypothetical protein
MIWIRSLEIQLVAERLDVTIGEIHCRSRRTACGRRSAAARLRLQAGDAGQRDRPARRHPDRRVRASVYRSRASTIRRGRTCERTMLGRLRRAWDGRRWPGLTSTGCGSREYPGKFTTSNCNEQGRLPAMPESLFSRATRYTSVTTRVRSSPKHTTRALRNEALSNGNRSCSGARRFSPRSNVWRNRARWSAPR